MKIIEIVFRKLKNTGDYENSTMEVKAIVEEGDDPNKIVHKLKRFADKHLEDE